VEFGKFTRDLLREFNSPGCLQFLETLTGIGNLMPDPYFEGGGLHQIEPGGFLKVHADFNWHPRLRLDRRLNLIVYLNQDWREEYNGHLELWDRSMSLAVRKVLPVFNRAVVFSTTSWAYHGHPEKLACPPGQTRKSLALYYSPMAGRSTRRKPVTASCGKNAPRDGKAARCRQHFCAAWPACWNAPRNGCVARPTG
jgi:hypothetical protein